jgi:hypothetical protein
MPAGDIFMNGSPFFLPTGFVMQHFVLPVNH